jgi:membrane-associated phospholipid phosphatase
MIPWLKITSFGDTVVMMPAAVAIIAWLVIGRAWRMAFWWSVLFTIGLALVVVTKIAFIGWGIGIRSLDFTGISGHAMRAAAVIPIICYLLLQKSSPGTRALGIFFGLMLGALISFSRIVVHAHSVSEAVAGFLLGAIISLGFIWISRSLEKPTLNRWLIAITMIALLPTSNAKPAPTQSWMNGVALYLSGHDRPYDRELWRLGDQDTCSHRQIHRVTSPFKTIRLRLLPMMQKLKQPNGILNLKNHPAKADQ